MYAVKNFKSKKELKEAVKQGPVACFQPGGVMSPDVCDGEHTAEGPHYPEPHKWYARVQVRNGQIVKVIS